MASGHRPPRCRGACADRTDLTATAAGRRAGSGHCCLLHPPSSRPRSRERRRRHRSDAPRRFRGRLSFSNPDRSVDDRVRWRCDPCRLRAGPGGRLPRACLPSEPGPDAGGTAQRPPELHFPGRDVSDALVPRSSSGRDLHYENVAELVGPGGRIGRGYPGRGLDLFFRALGDPGRGWAARHRVVCRAAGVARRLLARDAGPDADRGISGRLRTIATKVSKIKKNVIDAVASQKEVKLTTFGRKTGKPSDVTIWITTDGDHLYIRSGQGMRRQWPQNLVARGEGVLHIGNMDLKVKPRQVSDPIEARATSALYTRKYGEFVKASKPDEPLTPGEQASFELMTTEQ